MSNDKSKMEKELKMNSVSSVFSPSAPINSTNLFQGRIQQLMEVHSAVLERGEHIILHGDRGVGKTSLANIIDQRYTGAIITQ